MGLPLLERAQVENALFYSTAIETLRQLYPENQVFARAGDETRLVVSEPLDTLEGAWNDVPESTCGIVQPGREELRPFAPRPPTRMQTGELAPSG